MSDGLLIERGPILVDNPEYIDYVTDLSRCVDLLAASYQPPSDVVMFLRLRRHDGLQIYAEVLRFLLTFHS